MHEATQETIGILAPEGMVLTLDQVAPAPAKVCSVRAGNRLQQRRVQFAWVIRFNDPEFGHVRIELKLHLLEKQGVVDAAHRILHLQKPVAKEQLELLGLALEPASEFEELLKNAHSRADGFLSPYPSLSFLVPGTPSSNPGRILLEALGDGGIVHNPVARRPLLGLALDILPAGKNPVT